LIFIYLILTTFTDSIYRFSTRQRVENTSNHDHHHHQCDDDRGYHLIRHLDMSKCHQNDDDDGEGRRRRRRRRRRRKVDDDEWGPNDGMSFGP
jgi:hypothetical protein